MRLRIETELGTSYFAANTPPGILAPGLLAVLDSSKRVFLAFNIHKMHLNL